MTKRVPGVQHFVCQFWHGGCDYYLSVKTIELFREDWKMIKMITDVEIVKEKRFGKNVFAVRSQSLLWQIFTSTKEAEAYCKECELTYSINI
jgi:hypothetical protein